MTRATPARRASTSARRGLVASCSWLLLLVPLAVRGEECAYVANTNFDDIAVLSLVDSQLSASIPVGRAPVSVAIHPDGRTGYAVNEQDHSVSVFSTATRAVTGAIDLRCFDAPRIGCNPVDVAFSPDGIYAYVANLRSDNLTVIDTAAQQVTASLPAGGPGPSSVAIHSDGRTAYTTHLFANTIGVIDIEQRRARTIRVGDRPTDLALRPDGAFLYVTNGESASVSVVRLADSEVVTNLPVGGFPTGIAVDPTGSFAYVATSDGGTIVVIDTSDNSLVRAIDIGGVLGDVAFSPSRARAYVSEFGLGNVFVIATDSHTLSHFITIGGGAASQRLAVAEVAGGCPLPATPTPSPTSTMPPTPTRSPTGLPAPILVVELRVDGSELEVSRIDAFPDSGTLRIGPELLTYSGKQGSRLLRLARGVAGTPVTSHAAGATVTWVGMRGDANCDGAVSAADLGEFVQQRQHGLPGVCGGDFDGSGRVDDGDLEPLIGGVFTDLPSP